VAEPKNERGNKAAEDDGEGENVGGRNVGLESREGSTAARESNTQLAARGPSENRGCTGGVAIC
jgi:hypothetical protein